MRVDSEKGELEALRDTVSRRTKRKLDRACDVGGWLMVFASFQDVMDLSREEFRDILKWRLSLPILEPPLICNGCGAAFTVEYACLCNGGGGG